MLEASNSPEVGKMPMALLFFFGGDLGGGFGGLHRGLNRGDRMLLRL